jgi:bifunctional DNA-binding transcriptional regulator/antitoxin component of YhaV-PrlF toxin-antitoxin module
MEKATQPKTVRLRARGQLTIPREFREQLELGPDSAVSIARIGQTLVLAPASSKRAALARQVAAAMKTEGLSLEELLNELRSQRERYSHKAYPEFTRK